MPEVGLFTLKMRRKDATTSLTVTGAPFENLMPVRSLKTQVLPPFVGVGRFSARSGTTVNASLPPAFLKARRPS